eukprot:2575032-Amphidinium_carterae.1
MKNKNEGQRLLRLVHLRTLNAVNSDVVVTFLVSGTYCIELGSIPLMGQFPHDVQQYRSG